MTTHGSTKKKVLDCNPSLYFSFQTQKGSKVGILSEAIILSEVKKGTLKASHTKTNSFIFEACIPSSHTKEKIITLILSLVFLLRKTKKGYWLRRENRSMRSFQCPFFYFAQDTCSYLLFLHNLRSQYPFFVKQGLFSAQPLSVAAHTK